MARQRQYDTRSPSCADGRSTLVCGSWVGSFSAFLPLHGVTPVELSLPRVIPERINLFRRGMAGNDAVGTFSLVEVLTPHLGTWKSTGGN